MNKAELENKHIAELHTLAAKAGVERYRMLSRAELIAKLADGGSAGGGQAEATRQAPSRRQPSSGGQAAAGEGAEQRERPPRRRRRRSSGGKGEAGGEGRSQQGSGREPRAPRQPGRAAEAREPEPAPPEPARPAPPLQAAPSETSPRPRRRRRRFGRRGKQGVTLQDLLLPPAAGRQALLCAETREACTALLRGIASDLSGESNGPDPVALLIDPSPEELADWRREAPQAEIVAAGQPRHASDALAQAANRAAAGDDVILLVDSLTRLGEAYEDADAAKEFFDAGRVTSGTGTLTVVAALERS
jgi:hypothetical protein